MLLLKHHLFSETISKPCVPRKFYSEWGELVERQIVTDESYIVPTMNVLDEEMFSVPAISGIGPRWNNSLWDAQGRLCLTHSFPFHIMHFLSTCPETPSCMIWESEFCFQNGHKCGVGSSIER